MDPRLVAHRPALVYDPQEAYPAASAAMITDHPGSQHETGEARSWAKVEHMESDDGVHPVIYVAPFSHGNCFEPGAHPYVFGIDNPDAPARRTCPRRVAPWPSSSAPPPTTRCASGRILSRRG